ncbi:MAG: hypothetical protein A2284_11250 [Deltaproteobacteria bacterium RIFOXYA12_FULL_61_11]|nr:MAG: hypothetical protein A2284_11250 [Deltaproteobacteria bacterium RIFOXYA12_FULL_61_11]
MIGGCVVLGLVLFGILTGIVMFNALVRLRSETDNAWSQIDVQLRRRYDLVPNLVEVVKGYATHERETFDRVTQARSAAMQARGVRQKAASEQAFSTALGQLYLVVENYPELKADEGFSALREEVTSTENRLAFARQGYNDCVLEFNVKVQSFPSNLIASMFGFINRDFFQLENEAVTEVPRISMR